MRLGQNTVRKEFAPLNVVASIRVVSTASPLMQSFSALENEYLPSRDAMPLVLMPQIDLKAFDGSLPTKMVEADVEVNGVKQKQTVKKIVAYDNSYIITDNSEYPMTWYANGQPIYKVFAQADYTIDTVNEVDSATGYNKRGWLHFRKNLDRNQTVQFHFEGYVRDPRTNQAIFVSTLPETSGCIDAGIDQYTLVVNGPRKFNYNPVNDHLLYYDYLKANGLGAVAEDSVADDVSHLHTWNFQLKQGDDVVGADKYTVKVIDKSTKKEVSVDATDGIIAITNNSFTVDTRLQLNREFDLEVFMTRKFDNVTMEVAHVNLAYDTKYPEIRAIPLITTGYVATDKKHANGLKITSMSQRKTDADASASEIEYPDRLLNIYWYASNSLGGSHPLLGIGAHVVYDIADTGAGDTVQGDASKGIASCDYGEIYEGDWKAPLSVATDGNAYLSDGEEILAFNTVGYDDVKTLEDKQANE